MRTETIIQSIELDLSMFNSDFDPHNRAYQCRRIIKLIQANQPDSLNQRQFRKKICQVRGIGIH